MTDQTMNFLFCADRNVLAGLHVAASSVLRSLECLGGTPQFYLYGDGLTDFDIDLLRQTLLSIGKPFDLHVRVPDTSRLKDFPRLTGSIAAYFRLLAFEDMPVSRFLYLDTDTLCQTNLRPVFATDLSSCPLAMVSEAPIVHTLDTRMYEQLGRPLEGKYYNSGVILVDVDECRKNAVAEGCLRYLSELRGDYHDQSAINYVLHGRIASLEARYNCFTNVRANWPALKSACVGTGVLVHFVDIPKPWDLLGFCGHMMGQAWWNEFRKTSAYACRDAVLPTAFRYSWKKGLTGYRKVLKDKLLFAAYVRGLLRPKGVPE